MVRLFYILSVPQCKEQKILVEILVMLVKDSILHGNYFKILSCPKTVLIFLVNIIF